MTNERIKDGALPALTAALELLVHAHTRDDHQAGFVVEMRPALLPFTGVERSQYLDAWRVVRDALGYGAEPPKEAE